MVEEQYTAKDYVNAFRRRSKIFFGITGLLLAVAVAFALLPSDTYRATAEMRIDLEGPNIDVVAPMVLTNYADQYIKTLQQKVLDNSNVRRWLEESGAYSEAPDDVSQGELVSRLKSGIDIRMVYTSVLDEDSGREVNLITGFTTSFTSEEPEVSAYVANAVAQGFLEEDRATRLADAASASSFLGEQIAKKRAEIAEIESKIATFKEENAGKLPELMVLNMSTLERAERDLESVEREIRTLQQDLFFREAQLQEIRQGLGGAGQHLAQLEAEYNRALSLYGPEHPDVIRIKRQVAALTAGAAEGGTPELVQLQNELAAAQQRYSDEHPDVIRLKRQIEDLSSGSGPFGGGSIEDPLYLQLRAQINAINSNLEGLRNRAEELRQTRARTQDRLAQMPQVERQYQALQRELQTATLAFDNLRDRLSKAQQTEQFESGERGARLEQITAARAPETPTGPPRLAIIILGLFAAGTFGGGAAFLAEFSDSTIRGSKDIRAVMHTHAIATVPIVQNSVTRSQRRRRMMIMSMNVLMVAAIIFLVVSVVTG